MLGEGERAEVPISEAVAASGALPGIYEPVEIKGREFIDGGILSTTTSTSRSSAGRSSSW